MTNFEKWKQELTVEEMVRFAMNFLYKCNNCPAVKCCSEDEKDTCNDSFVVWANAEYVEPPKKAMLVIDMPNGCNECLIRRYSSYTCHLYCTVTESVVTNFKVRAGDCPLVEVKE